MSAEALTWSAEIFSSGSHRPPLQRAIGTQLKSLLRKMPVKRINPANALPAHAVKTGDIHKAQMPPLRQPPLFKGQLKTIFANRQDFY